MTAVACRAACSFLRSREVRTAQIDKGDIAKPEVGEPQRVAGRRDDDKDREPLRRQNARKNEGLDQPRRHRAAGSGGANQQIGGGDKPFGLPARRSFAGALSDIGVHDLTLRSSKSAKAKTMAGQTMAGSV